MQKQRTSTDEGTKKVEVQYLGIDVHVGKWVIVAQDDGLTPKPAVSFKLEEKLIAWLKKQQKRAVKIVACYEAGPTGYHLQRTCEEMGITCYVVAAKKWAENEDHVKTDKRDAKILCQRLELYERGNHSALNVLRVPTVEEEMLRLSTRHRLALRKEIRRLAQRGRGIGCTYGISMKGRWWKGYKWEDLQSQAPPQMLLILESTKRLLEGLETEEKEQIKTIEDLENQNKEQRPKWLGALTFATIKAEVCDFTRFNNRRQVSSYTGLCPSEYSSGGKRSQGKINKHGNPTMRHCMIEATWRLILNQPNWHVFQKYQTQYQQASPARKKQLVVAMARKLAIDLWRIATNQTTLEKLGLEPAV